MTHDELLESLEYPWVDMLLVLPRAEKYKNALRAVVELHKPYPLKPHKPDGVLVCQECTDYSTANWPCATIKAIEKELE